MIIIIIIIIIIIHEVIYRYGLFLSKNILFFSCWQTRTISTASGLFLCLSKAFAVLSIWVPIFQMLREWGKRGGEGEKKQKKKLVSENGGRK